MWAAHNGCVAEPVRTELGDGSMRVVFRSAGDRNEVVHYTVAGAGHQIPEDFEGGLVGMCWDFCRRAMASSS